MLQSTRTSKLPKPPDFRREAACCYQQRRGLWPEMMKKENRAYIFDINKFIYFDSKRNEETK
jgi:hypothetical protein